MLIYYLQMLDTPEEKIRLFAVYSDGADFCRSKNFSEILKIL